MADFLVARAANADYRSRSGNDRFVRKIYDPSLNSRDSSHRCYHAELFEGPDGSCWERHEMHREMFRTTGHAA
jgi:hypothetical protein